jgi:hypothetical protein
MGIVGRTDADAIASQQVRARAAFGTGLVNGYVVDGY